MRLLFAVAIRMLLLLLLILPVLRGHKASSLPSLSCGNITGLRWPFYWKGHRPPNSYAPAVALECGQNNRTTMYTSSGRMIYVLEINYEEQFARLIDPTTSREPNLSSCPLEYFIDLYEIPFLGDSSNIPVAFIHCLRPVNSVRYVKAPFCGNRTNIFSDSSQLYNYVVVGLLDPLWDSLEESCMFDNIGWASFISDNSSLDSILNGLVDGFKLRWYDDPCKFHLAIRIYYVPSITFFFQDRYSDYLECKAQYWLVVIQQFVIVGLVGLRALEFVVGFPLLLCLVAYKWRRRHLCMNKDIENFLRDQNHLTPIKYRYSEVKKMTKNFNMRLGEGACGIVYKGNLQSGPCVAVKMMKQFMASEEEFINEFGTLGHIHHCNIVQLIGFCMEGTKCGLVYEFLPNGSLDRYIFSQQSLGNTPLKYKKLFEIALGVACGINYLHHGCRRQILHFDIKPHNILLDENFNPKLSDFGLAQLYESGDSVINLTSARGTVGYMAPEMFYKNIGSISRKVDIYSFGMLLIEMVGRRTNMDPLFEKTSQIYLSSWVYEHVTAKKDLEINDATEEERKMVMRIIIVALWCIQMKPCDRPMMNKVVEMLEGDFELPMPPKPFIAPRESEEDQLITRTYSVDYVVQLTNN